MGKWQKVLLVNGLANDYILIYYLDPFFVLGYLIIFALISLLDWCLRIGLQILYLFCISGDLAYGIPRYCH